MNKIEMTIDVEATLKKVGALELELRQMQKKYDDLSFRYRNLHLLQKSTKEAFQKSTENNQRLLNDIFRLKEELRKAEEDSK